MNRFCPKCGKEIKEEEMINNFCINCYLKDNDIIIIPEIEIIFCVKCNRIRYTNKWYDNLEDIERDIAKHIKVKDIPKSKILVKLDLDFEKNNYTAKIIVKTIISGTFKNIEKDVDVVVKKDTCVICSRIAGNYYTTILQIRFNDKKLQKILSPKIYSEIESIKNSLNSRSAKPSANLHIVKEVKQKTGFDLYLDNLKLAYNLVQHLMKHKTAINFNTSKTLVGLNKEGQRTYRTTFAVHFGNKEKS
ncbi:MAG: NMD3-related protein [archaeon]